MIINFDGSEGKDSASFRKWIESNPEGFYINHKGECDNMLHRSICPHVNDPRDLDLTTNPKFCYLDRQRLEIWAKQDVWAKANIVGKLDHCSTCNPKSNL